MIISSPSELYKVSELLTKSDIWTYDIETNSLNPRTGQIIGFSAASDAGSFYIIHKAWNGTNLNDLIPKHCLKPIIDILSTKKLVTWNGSFDTRFTAHYFGVKMWEQIYADGMLQAHVLNENRFNYGLKEISAEILGRDVLTEKEAMAASIKANGGTATEYYKANAQLMAEYGKKDAELTWKLYKKFDADIKAQGLYEFFQTEYMDLYRLVTVNMEYKGVPIDVPALEKARVEIQADMLTLEAEIQTAIAPLLTNFHDWYIRTKFPFKFSGEFKQKLGERLAPDWWPRTKAGGYAFDKKALEKCVKQGYDINCLFYRLHEQIEKPSTELIREIQLELLAADLKTKGDRPYGFNLLSTDHLKRLFFKAHGGLLDETPLSRTPTGAPQINDEFLSIMAAKYNWAASLQVYRSLSKLRGTYIDGILERSEGGVFYPSFFQHRTVSGRYGSNIQQIPRPIAEGSDHPYIVKYTNLCRTFFIAGPGHTFVDDDYESLEPHIFAHVSGDPALQEIFNRGHDFYSTIAIDTEGLKGVSADKAAPNYLGKVNKAARQNAKAYALGLAYGLSPYKLQFMLNISQAEAERLAKQYFTAYPALAAWMAKSKKQACETGQIRTLSGRVRRFPELPPLYRKYGDLLWDSLELWKEYHESPRDYETAKGAARLAKNCVNNASNVQIQGFAASIVNKASIQIAKEFKRLNLSAYICASIHDEIIVRCEEKDVDTVKQIVQANMEGCVELSVKLKAPASSGYTFLEAKGA